jgi:hypothetical protein
MRIVYSAWYSLPGDFLTKPADCSAVRQQLPGEYRELLAVMKIEQSMSRKGNCWDNGVPSRREERRSPLIIYAARG